MGYDEGLFKQILGFCRRIANPCQITSACAYDDYALRPPGRKAMVKVLLVVQNFQPKLMSYVKTFGGVNVIVFAVDERVFEMDVERGLLGEALAEGLALSYIALVNADYLRVHEVALKKRLILELLGKLILDFPELSSEIRIKPEYFMYEVMLSRARLFPPAGYGFLSITCENRLKMEHVLEGYSEALRQLEKDGVIDFLNGYVKVSEDFVDSVRRSRRARFINLYKAVPRALFASTLKVFPQIVSAILQDVEAFAKFWGEGRKADQALYGSINPQKYLYVPTSQGLVSLADRVNIESFARTVLSTNGDVKVAVNEIGGVLNDVYLIRAVSNGVENKAIIKRFRNLSSFKWLPPALWAIGVRTFAISGRLRLEKECAINKFLSSKGFNVPRILHVNYGERLIFMEYVEGESLNTAIKKIASSKTVNDVEEGLNVVKKVGEVFAKVHALGISLGDTKPSNIIIGRNGEIYLLDFEQASRGGDKTWDVAELLYYAGYYVAPLFRGRKVELIAKAFVNGYLTAGGDVKVVEKAGDPKYTRVFSIFVSPITMFAISNVCRKANTLRRYDG